MLQRDAYFDNAKLILIFLVVFGHLIQPFTSDSQLVSTMYTWIYFFHMPAFIMISGFFARGHKDLSYVKKLAKQLLIPYIIFQLTYTGFYFAIGKNSWQSSLLDPQWSLWFLISLFSWHILLIIFKKIRPLYGISVAIVIGLLIGYISDIGNYFSLSRTFVFFPFFLVGYWIRREHITFIKQRFGKIISVSILLLTISIVFIFVNQDLGQFNVGWLLASKSYATLNAVKYGSLIRLFVYTMAFILSFCLLVWIPEREFRFTYLGTRTLYVYLLHGFIIQTARQFDLFSVSSALDVIGLAGVSLLIVFVLSHRWIVSVWQPLIEGRTTMLRTIIGND